MWRRLALLGLLTAGCKDREPVYDLSADELLDPAACQDCHPAQYQQWSGSMHAYASIDPVFRAMNARGQRETGGELGELCVQCHAPMALRAGVTADGTDLDEVPDHLQGVTCAYCHLVDEVTGTHNAAHVVADDEVLRGGIPDPQAGTAHGSAYSALHDRDDPASSDMCGSCHDVVLPSGLHLEKSYLEWQESVFSVDGPTRLSCGHCHMPRSYGPAAADGPTRPVHDHLMAGVDVSLVETFSDDANREAAQASLDYTVLPLLCVGPLDGGSEISLTLENAGAGHRWPSGATHDRRAWVELTAWSGEEVLLSTVSLAEGQALAEVEDPHRWELHDVATKADGTTAHQFWEVAALEERTLPVATTTDPTDPAFFHQVTQKWPLQGAVPDRVEARVYIRPFGLEILDDLIESGDLDAAVRDRVPTFELAGAAVVWSGEVGSCAP